MPIPQVVCGSEPFVNSEAPEISVVMPCLNEAETLAVCIQSAAHALRKNGIDGEILKAAQIDGASAFATYRRIVIPIMRPVFLSALIILTHLAIKSYDLVLSVTGKNPGGAAELPSTFMYSYTFTRNQMAVGSASAVIMLMTIAAIMVPYLYSELKEKSR